MRALVRVWICLLLLACLATADESRGSGTPSASKWVTFACRPVDAQVYLEVGTAQPYLLGKANEKLPLDLSLFDGRRQISLTFRREGWLDDTRVLQQQNIQSRYFASRDRYPDPGQGAVVLNPKDDLASRLLQIRYYLGQWRLGLALLLVVLGVGGTIAFRRWSQLRRGHQRAAALERLTAHLDHGDPLAGRLLGKWRLLEKLGAGGMSTVYRAVDNEDLTAEAAVKVLDSKLAEDERAVKRFWREVDICKSLSHPNVLVLYDYGEQDGIVYLVMEKLEGGTLAHELDKGVFSPARVAEVCGPLMEALSYLHKEGITHRDVKPDNVFLTNARRIKLMDFGISRGEKFTRATATQMGLGTPAYMSPEQVEGKVEPATDQYAMGCMVYEMLSGAPPFTDADPFALAFKHVGQRPDPLTDRVEEVPEALNAVVMRMLEKDVPRRYASMAEAREALLEACSR